jgi:diguanylate cyclase (GGDEF)-like protein
LGLDAATLITTVVVVLIVLSGLLLLTWMQNRSVPSLAIWAGCFGLCAGAAILWNARAALPTFVAIDVANAMRLFAFGLAWQAARLFVDRKGNWPLAAAPAALWIAAAGLSVFDGDHERRVLLTSLTIGAYAFALSAELWRGWSMGMRMALPAAIIFGLHGGAFLARAAAGLLYELPHLSLDAGIETLVSPFVVFEGLIAAVAAAFLLASAAKEKIELKHRDAAEIDPLTGIANRRGFDAALDRVLAQARRSGSPAALLLLDLDHFKTVNDTWGHQVGDFVLQAVARTIRQELRGSEDVAARLGGEEFAVALPGARADHALLVAERMRRAVAGIDIRRADSRIGLSISIGVAAARETDLPEALLSLADAALYRAKANGRNRVECALPSSARRETDRAARMIAEMMRAA